MVVGAPVEERSAARRQFVVRAHHDDETGGWWADSDDVPGLVTEAATYDELVDRVIAVVPELCKANDITVAKGDVIRIRREWGNHRMTSAELDQALSKLAEDIWAALRNDDTVSDLLHELVAAKLDLDGVDRRDSELTDATAVAIFEGHDPDNPRVIRPKAFVPSREWAKNSLYNLALQWVLNQAICRMQVEHRFPSDIGKSTP